MTNKRFSGMIHRTRLRLVVMFAVGVVVALLVGVLGSWAYAPALGWAAAVFTYLGWVWPVVGFLDSDGTAAHATREDPGRTASDVLTLAAALGSMGGVALILLDARSAPGAAKAGIVGLALAIIVLSWLLVHTVYTLRYAALYYRDNGGVDFNENTRPRYSDFAYLAFTIGMTFQVSDTDIRTHAIRAAALRHALLSYMLGALVLATTINLVTGLIH